MEALCTVSPCQNMAGSYGSSAAFTSPEAPCTGVIVRVIAASVCALSKRSCAVDSLCIIQGIILSSLAWADVYFFPNVIKT